VSSRQEEKERRRQERMAAEQAHAQSAARRRRLGMVLGGVVALAVAVIVVLAVVAGGDDDAQGGSGNGQSAEAPTQGNDRNLDQAASAAGCEVANHRSEGRGHTTETVKYNQNPPTSGEHDPTPSEDGEYEPTGPPDIEQSVHALEHGRILIQYKGGSPAQRIAQLRNVYEEETKGESAYHSLLFQNQTNMHAQVAATAWSKSLTCPQWNDQVFDAIRAFRRQYVDKGPEFIP